jgi:hypothetical protein
VLARVTVFAPASAVTARMRWLFCRVEPRGAARCVLHLDGESLDSLAYALGFLGFEFRVHEPAALAEHLRLVAERLARGAAGCADGDADGEADREAEREADRETDGETDREAGPIGALPPRSTAEPPVSRRSAPARRT